MMYCIVEKMSVSHHHGSLSRLRHPRTAFSFRPEEILFNVPQSKLDATPLILNHTVTIITMKRFPREMLNLWGNSKQRGHSWGGKSPNALGELHQSRL